MIHAATTTNDWNNKLPCTKSISTADKDNHVQAITVDNNNQVQAVYGYERERRMINEIAKHIINRRKQPQPTHIRILS